MRLVRIFLVCVAALGQSASAAASDTRDPLPFVIFETADAPGTLDPQKLSECLHLSLRELGLDGRDLPRIAVFHISPQAGRILGVTTNSNWKNNGGGTPRYEMWIVGRPSNYLFSYMLENILERHFQVKVDETARARMIRHIESGLNDTVDVRSFR